MASEKRFENKIKEYLKEKGCWNVKFFANRMTKVGVPDIIACVNGRFVGIEVKAENGRPSELQLWNQKEIRKSNGISVIAYPEQWDELKKLIDKLLEEPTIKNTSQTKFDRR